MSWNAEDDLLLKGWLYREHAREAARKVALGRCGWEIQTPARISRNGTRCGGSLDPLADYWFSLWLEQNADRLAGSYQLATAVPVAEPDAPLFHWPDEEPGYAREARVSL